MRSVKKKLRSTKGASITFGLLIFLVCAMVSSVILVAATTSAGRMSQTAESDQRYYAVTSAAELMKGMIAEKSATVVKITETTKTTNYKDGRVDGEPTIQPTNPIAEVYLVEKPAGEINYSTDTTTTPPGDLTVKVAGTGTVQTPQSILTDAAYKYESGAAASSDKELSITLDSHANVAVTVRTSIDANGNITMYVFNTNGSKYTQKLTFAANISRNTSEQSKNNPIYDISEVTKTDSETGATTTFTTYKIDTVEKKIETVTLTWTLSNVETSSPPESI